jgi:sugar lactone lactonase YvrE
MEFMEHPLRPFLFRPLLAAMLVFASACGNRDDSTAPTGNGSIVLTITMPEGANPSVTITGPDGFSRVVTSTTTITHLAAGSYTITADSIVTQSAIVGYSVDTAAITGSPIIVTSSGSTAATVTYAFARQHGALWVSSNENTFLSGFAPSQLLVSGVALAADTIGNLDTPPGLAFDADGNLWVATNQVDTLKMYTVAQRNTGSAITTPARVLVSSGVASPQAMNFDSHGNLWVADYENGLLEFTAAQLTTGGDVGSPAIAISDTMGGGKGTGGAYAVAFDNSGNAWVGEDNYSNVVEYTVAQLASSGSPTPSVRLGADPRNDLRVVGGTGGANSSAAVGFGFLPTSLSSPDALAFDTHGNLWVGNYYNENVVAYTAAQRATSGDPTPSITVSIPTVEPYGIAFDKSGGLWITDDNSYTVLGLTAAQLATSGVPAPSILLTSGADNSINDPQQLAFDEWVVTSTPLPAGSRVQYSRHASARKLGVHKPIRKH